MLQRLVPVQVQGLTSGGTAIATWGGHTCAIVNGAALCWGYNYYGELGNGTTANSTIPVPVQGLTAGVTAITVGNSHTCAIVNGAALCWGYNSFGQLGNGIQTNNAMTPVQVQGLTSGVTSIAAGETHTCAIVNGRAQCWGNNQFGQLGTGDTVTSAAPVTVVAL